MHKYASDRIPTPSSSNQLITQGLDHGNFVCRKTQGGGYVVQAFEKTRHYELSFAKKALASRESEPMWAYRTEKALNLRGAVLAELAKEKVDMDMVEKLALKFAKQPEKGGSPSIKLNWGYTRGSNLALDAAFDLAYKNVKNLLEPSSRQAKPISDAARKLLTDICGALEPADTAAGSAPSRREVLKEAEKVWGFVAKALSGFALGIANGPASKFVSERHDAVASALEKANGDPQHSGWSNSIDVLRQDDLPLVEAALREMKMELAVWTSRATPAEVASAKSFSDRGIQVVWLRSIIDALLQMRDQLEAQAAKGSARPGTPVQVSPPQAAAGAVSDLKTVQMTLGQLNEQLLRLVDTVHSFRRREKGVSENDHHWANRAIDPVMAEIGRLEQLQMGLLAAQKANAGTTTTATTLPGTTSTSMTTTTATLPASATTTTTSTTTTPNAKRS